MRTQSNELFRWLGLRELLTPSEQLAVRRELAAIAEAEAFMDRLRERSDRPSDTEVSEIYGCLR